MEQVLSEIIFSVFRRYFPVIYRSDIKDEQLYQYKKLFGWYDIAFLPLFFLIIASITMVVYWIGTILSTIFHTNFSNKWLHEFYAPEEFWILPGLILGFGFSAVLMILLGKYLLFKKNWVLYEEFTNRKYGFDGMKVSWLFVRIFCPIAIVVSLLGMDWHIKIDKNEMEIKDFFSLVTDHLKLSKIKTISSFKRIVSPNGNIFSHPHFTLLFVNGTEWNSFNSLIEESDTLTQHSISKLINKQIVIQDIDYSP